MSFCLLFQKKYIGFDGKAFKLIMSYFSDCTQRVQIDGILSEFASIVCLVPQGSVLGPLKFCLYMLPLSAILRFFKWEVENNDLASNLFT